MNEDKIITALDAVYSDLKKFIADRGEILKDVLDLNFPEEDYDITTKTDIINIGDIQDNFSVLAGEDNKFKINSNSFAEIDDFKVLSTKKLSEVNVDIITKIKNDYPEEYRGWIFLLARSFRREVVFRMHNVEISNENGESHRIPEIYGKFILRGNGKLEDQFQISRNKYTLREARYSYTHSHIPSRAMGNLGYNVRWCYPCTGEGPINRTRILLHNSTSKDSDEEYFGKLSMYVNDMIQFMSVESLEGVPYLKINQLDNYDYDLTGIDSTAKLSNVFSNYHNNFETVFAGQIYNKYKTSKFPEQYSFIKEFIKELLLNLDIKYKYIDNIISPAYDSFEFNSLVTREFKKYYNNIILNSKNYSKEILKDNLLNTGVLQYYKKNGLDISVIVHNVNNRSDSEVRVFRDSQIIENIDSPTEITFKGERLTFQVIDIEDYKKGNVENEIEKPLMLNQKITNFIYQLIIKNI